DAVLARLHGVVRRRCPGLPAVRAARRLSRLQQSMRAHVSQAMPLPGRTARQLDPLLEASRLTSREKTIMRKLVSALTPVVALLVVAGLAAADTFPSKPIRVVVPFAAGSATDIVPRTVFEQVSAQLGQSIIIDNRPGGGTTIGTAAVAKADPDGYTVLVHSNGFLTTPAIQANIPSDPVPDFSAVTPLGNLPMVLVVSPNKNIRTVQDLVAAAKARPGSINYAAAGIGTPPHLTTERFRMAAGFEGQLVPFKGAPEALTE